MRLSLPSIGLLSRNVWRGQGRAFSRRSVLDTACELLQKVLEAHGGLDRWNSFETVQATIVTGGQLFGMKGTPQDSTPRRMIVATRREWASVMPYGADDQRTDFTPNRVAIEKINGAVIKERLRPSEHAEGKAVDAPWNALNGHISTGMLSGRT